MAGLDRALADLYVQRLARLTPDARPQWGKMNVPQLLGHLRIVVLYTMGQGPEMPFKGNFVTRNVFRHLILMRMVAIPKNVPLPKPKGIKEMPPPPEGTVEQLREVLGQYLDRYEQRQLKPQMHPYFGTLSPGEWNKFHVSHFTHHLKQFGV